MAAELPREEALRVLDISRADAWFEYAESCRQAATGSSIRYDEVEPWAWARLQQRLRAIAARASKLGAAP